MKCSVPRPRELAKRAQLTLRELGQQRLWRKDPELSDPPDRQEVAAISGNEDVSCRAASCGKDPIVVGIPAHCRDLGWRCRAFDREATKPCGDRDRLRAREPKLLLEHPGEFAESVLGDQEVDALSDRYLDHPAGRALSDQRRNQNVGVAGDPKRQRRSLRTSSTSLSASSGPMALTSAATRP